MCASMLKPLLGRPGRRMAKEIFFDFNFLPEKKPEKNVALSEWGFALNKETQFFPPNNFYDVWSVQF